MTRPTEKMCRDGAALAERLEKLGIAKSELCTLTFPCGFVGTDDEKVLAAHSKLTRVASNASIVLSFEVRDELYSYLPSIDEVPASSDENLRHASADLREFLSRSCEKCGALKKAFIVYSQPRLFICGENLENAEEAAMAVEQAVRSASQLKAAESHLTEYAGSRASVHADRLRQADAGLLYIKSRI